MNSSVWYLQYCAQCDDLITCELRAGPSTCLSTTLYRMKERQRDPIPAGLNRLPLKLIKHFADTTCVSPSPAGLVGCRPLHFLSLINLKFRVRASNGCYMLKFRQKKVLYATSLYTFKVGVYKLKITLISYV